MVLSEITHVVLVELDLSRLIVHLLVSLILI